MTALKCGRAVLEQTLILLQAGGAKGHERVVLWLASASSPGRVVQAYEPEQRTARNRFHLPPDSIRALTQHLRGGRLRVAAQIHTHPQKAFHSRADAEWAIIRHVGALSLVLPRFAADTTIENFLDQVVTYEHTKDGDWVLVPNRGDASRLEMIP